MNATNPVTAVPSADARDAARHFAARLTFETDCADVHAALGRPEPGFVLLDVRSPALFERAHLPGALSLPRARIRAEALASYPQETLFVVYCAGPHCNGATRAALELARLGRAVKEMLGGISGWRTEGFELVGAEPETNLSCLPTEA